MGHITIQPDGPMCACGHRGHLEAFASGTAIARDLHAAIAAGESSVLPAGQPISGKMISDALYQGDPLALRIIQRAGSYIGLGLANYLHIFNPSAVIIGGGVSRTGHFLLDPIRTSIHAHVMAPDFDKDLLLTTAALGDDAGLMGALALARTVSPGG
jgi:glucokinase